MFRTALLILSGNAMTSLLSLARNLVIARLIPVGDYGIAATFAIAMSLIEMISAMGLQQQIVQAKEGDNDRFQAALQGFQALRGLLSGMVLFAAAGPIADFMNLPDLVWAYRLVALIPVLNGFVHFDVYRLNRYMRFGPMILSTLVPVAISLIAVWPLALWFGDYRVMLYAIMIQALLTVALSHLVAERRFRMVFDRAIMGRSLAFGWPLLINNVLLFGVFQGDRLLVGRELGVEVLAIFSIGVMLTLTPTLVMSKSMLNFFLPQLSKAGDPVRFARLATMTMQVALLNGTVMMVGVFLLGKPLVDLVLGLKYADVVPLLGALSVIQALRVAKSGGAVVALARGQTGNAMISNLCRVATLPLIWIALVRGDGLWVVIGLAICGELAGYAVSLILVWWRLDQRLGPLVPSMVVGGLLAALVALPESERLAWELRTALVLGLALLQVLLMSELRRLGLRVLGRTR